MFVTALLVACLAAPVPKGLKGEYYPLVVGERRVYQEGGREFVEEVTGVEAKDGGTRATLTHSTSRWDTWQVEEFVKDGAVFRSRIGKEAFDPPFRLLDLRLKAGAKWEAVATVADSTAAGYAGEMAAGEEEEVTVPAGKFKAIPVTWTVTTAGGEPLPKPRVYAFWYAQGVGQVKYTHPDGERVLKSFTPGKDAKK
jgi:hypothetical protein